MARVSFFIDGKFDSRHKIGGATNYRDAQRRNDRRVEGGPLYQEYYPRLNQRFDALIIGNGQGPDRPGFLGMIDEVRIHETGLSAADIGKIANGEHEKSGKVISPPIKLPDGKRWARFAATCMTPSVAMNTVM